MVQTINHVNLGIIMDCVNMTKVVYQMVLNKWVDSTNTVSDWKIYIVWTYNHYHHLGTYGYEA